MLRFVLVTCSILDDNVLKAMSNSWTILGLTRINTNGQYVFTNRVSCTTILLPLKSSCILRQCSYSKYAQRSHHNLASRTKSLVQLIENAIMAAPHRQPLFRTNVRSVKFQNQEQSH